MLLLYQILFFRKSNSKFNSKFFWYPLLIDYFLGIGMYYCFYTTGLWKSLLSVKQTIDKRWKLRTVPKVETIHLKLWPWQSLYETTTVTAPAVSSPLLHSAPVVLGVCAPYTFRSGRKQEQCAFENQTKTCDLSF